MRGGGQGGKCGGGAVDSDNNNCACCHHLFLGLVCFLKESTPRALYKRCIKYKIMCMGDGHMVFLRAHSACCSKLEGCAHKNQCVSSFPVNLEDGDAPQKRWTGSQRGRMVPARVFQQDQGSHLLFFTNVKMLLFEISPNSSGNELSETAPVHMTSGDCRSMDKCVGTF